MSKTFRPFALAVAVACVSGTALTYRLFNAATSDNATSLSGAARPASAPAAPAVPLWFERNTGEYPAQVLYASRSLRQTVYLTSSQMTVAAPSGEAVGISWTNAKQARIIEGRQPVAARVDYFRGKDRSQWRTGNRANTARFGEVRYEQIYNGVDLVFHPQLDKLEHDFVVAPGADPSQIGLRFDGASSVHLANDGSLAIRTASGSEIRQTKPVAYQEIDGHRVEVAAAYRITGDASAEFTLGAYDASKQLVIDPVLDYSTYLNSSGSTTAVSVAAQPGTSFVWVAGTTNASDFPVGGAPNAPIRDTNLGLRDIFLAKLDTSKFGTDSLVYAGFVGGSGADEALAMTLDNDGNAVIVGSTGSFDFPIVGSMDSEIEGGNDAIILKIDPRREGPDALVYTTFLGGNALDYATAVTTDSTGRIIVAGYTVSENFPLTANAIQRNRQRGYELFISRIDPNAGTSGLQYSTYYGGSNTDIARAVAVDPRGRILVAGNTSSDNFPIGNEPLQATYHGAGDMFLIRVDPEKSGLDGIDYGTFIGGNGVDSAEAIHLDADGNVYIAGYTTSTDMPVGGSAPQLTSAGASDLYVIKLSIPSNQVLFASYFGDGGTDVAYSMKVNASGRVYLTGYTYSQRFPVTANALQARPSGIPDAIVVVMDTVGTAAESLVYASYLGTPGLDYGYGISASSACSIAVTGTTTGKAFPTTGNAYERNANGFPGTFLSVIDICR
jgi:hypothetical protein